MAPREGSLPHLDVRHGVDPRPRTRLRSAACPHGAGGRCGAPTAVAGPAGAGQPLGADVGRRPGLRHRPPRAPDRRPQTGVAAPGPRPGDAAHPRSVRAHPSALAVHGHRGPTGRQGRAGAEDAPHDHRRRGRGADGPAVPRLRPRRTRSGAPRRGQRRRRRSTAVADDGGDRSRPVRRRVPSAGRHRPPGEGPARRPDLHPDGGRGDPRHDPRNRHATVRRRAGPLAALAAALPAPAVRGRPGPVRRDQGGRDPSRRHPQHRLPDRGRRGRRALPHRARRAGRPAARLDGRQHADRALRRQCVLARPDDGADRRDADHGAVQD